MREISTKKIEIGEHVLIDGVEYVAKEHDGDCLHCDVVGCGDWFLIPCEDGLILKRVVKQPVWVHKPNDYAEGVYECSACGEPYILDDTPTAHNYHFCPNCGAKMEGVKEESK